MKLQKLGIVAALALTIVSLLIGFAGSVSAQQWHRPWHHGYGRPVYVHRNVVVRRNVYVTRTAYVHPWGQYYHAGPGWGWHSWAWYNNHPAAWRALHPYHGSPNVGIWVHI